MMRLPFGRRLDWKSYRGTRYARGWVEFRSGGQAGSWPWREVYIRGRGSLLLSRTRARRRVIKQQIIDTGKAKIFWCDESMGGCGKSWFA